MKKTQQIFGINRHDIASKNSLSLTHHLVNYNYRMLLDEAGDADIDRLLNKFGPIFITWNKGIAKCHDAFDKRVKATSEMNKLNEFLVDTKAPFWVGKVWSVYAEGTPNAQLILPHARKPIITGNNEKRINGMADFIKNLKSVGGLDNVRKDINEFLTNYRAMNLKQKKADERLKKMSQEQQQLRKKAVAALLGIEGALIEKYCETPEQVDPYFAVTAMRRHAKKKLKSDGYAVFLLPDEIKLLDLHFTGKETWEVTNNGDFEACVFFGNTSTISTIPAIKFVIQPGESLQIDLSTLTNDMRFSYAANLSNETEGELNILQVA